MTSRPEIHAKKKVMLLHHEINVYAFTSSYFVAHLWDLRHVLLC